MRIITDYYGVVFFSFICYERDGEMESVCYPVNGHRKKEGKKEGKEKDWEASIS